MIGVIKTVRNLCGFQKCSVHISAVSNGTNKMMNKILQRNAGKKKKRTDSPILQSPSSFSKGAFEGKQSGNVRRVTVLNKLFMRQITDLMASGESSHLFIGYGLEINRVKITPDFQTVHIFWLAKGDKHDELLESTLEEEARNLRRELSALRVMGEVPKLKFVKDEYYAILAKLDVRLSEADYGEDFEPTAPATKLKSEFQLNTTLPSDIRLQIEQLDNECLNVDVNEEHVPEMPQNVLGLNHGDIMERVRKSMKKSQAVHRLNPDTSNVQFNEAPSINEDPVLYASARKQREAFKEFLAKRQLSKLKANRDTEKDDFNEYFEEYYSQQEKLNENKLLKFFEDKDYIEEDEEDRNR